MSIKFKTTSGEYVEVPHVVFEDNSGAYNSTGQPGRWTTEDGDIKKIMYGNQVVWEAEEEDDLFGENGYFQIKNISPTLLIQSFKVVTYSNPTAVTMQYTLDKINWLTVRYGESIYVPYNMTCYFRADAPSGYGQGNMTTGISVTKYYKFEDDDDTNVWDCTGNIMSLVDSTVQSLTIPSAYCFGNLLRGFNITHCPKFPATTLTRGCYCGTFYGCTKLLDSPDLPATGAQPGAYYSMFENCTALTTMGKIYLTSTADYVCRSMFAYTAIVEPTQLNTQTFAVIAQYAFGGFFNHCDQLKTGLIVNGLVLNASCYREMYYACTQLENIQTDIVGTVASGQGYNFYQMFRNCPKLTKLPNIRSSHLEINSCYQMFSYCNGATEGPKIYATEIVGNKPFDRMFQNCINLRSVAVNFATWGTGSDGALQTYGWFNTAAQYDGTFYYTQDSLDVTIKGTSNVPIKFTPQKVSSLDDLVMQAN